MVLRVVSILSAVFASLGLLFLALADAVPASTAQTPPPFQPVIGSDVQHDTSPPLSELSRSYQRPAALQALQALNEANRALPKTRLDPEFLQAIIDRGIDPVRYLLALEPTDPVVQGHLGLPDTPNAMPPTLKNFEGTDNVNAVLPPDPNGDIGYDPATGKKY